MRRPDALEGHALCGEHLGRASGAITWGEMAEALLIMGIMTFLLLV